MGNYSNETNYPPPPIVDSFDDCLPPKIDENECNIADIPPPPALEALDIETKTVSNGKTENENVEIGEIDIGQVMDTNGVETNRILSPVSKGNTAEIVETLNGNKKESNGQNVEQKRPTFVDLLRNENMNESEVEAKDGTDVGNDIGECINEETEDDDEDELILKLPSASPAPVHMNGNGNTNKN